MITGMHAIIYSTDPDADRAFLRDVLKFPHVDAGEGWLIFGLPPSELAVHPSDLNDRQELFLMCADIQAFIQEMAWSGTALSPIQHLSWGRLVYITLPGGSRLGVYQPTHPRPQPPDPS